MEMQPRYVDQFMGVFNPPQIANQMKPMQFNQGITAEEENQLKERNQQGQNQFFRPIQKIEEIASRCTHKHGNTIALSDVDSEGYRTCSICGARFHAYNLDEITPKQVEDLCNKVVDVMESVKLYKGDINPNIARVIYPATLIIKQIPGMWRNATDYIRTYMGNGGNAYTYNDSISPWAKYNMLYNNMGYNQYNPAFGGMPMPGAVPYQQGFAQYPYPQQQYADPNVQGYPAPIPVQEQQAPVQQPQAQQVPAQQQVVGYPPSGQYWNQPAPQQPVVPMQPLINGYTVQPNYVPYGGFQVPNGGVQMPSSNPIGYVQGTPAQAPTPTAAPTAPVTMPTQTAAPATKKETFEG